jgi:hypothetical protein
LANFETNPKYERYFFPNHTLFASLICKRNEQIGHAILAEFESTLSAADIARFVSILTEEENCGSVTGVDKLSAVNQI